jgi:hypothetical protein
MRTAISSHEKTPTLPSKTGSIPTTVNEVFTRILRVLEGRAAVEGKES